MWVVIGGDTFCISVETLYIGAEAPCIKVKTLCIAAEALYIGAEALCIGAEALCIAAEALSIVGYTGSIDVKASCFFTLNAVKDVHKIPRR